MAIGIVNNMNALGFAKGASRPWYNIDGIDPIAAYNMIWASDQAGSKINLVNPGTYNLVDTGHVPDWVQGQGSRFHSVSSNATRYFDTGITLQDKNYTAVGVIIPAFLKIGSESIWGCLNNSYPTNAYLFQATVNPDLVTNRFEWYFGRNTNVVIKNGAYERNDQYTSLATSPNGLYVNGVKSTDGGLLGNPNPVNETFYLGTAHWTAGGGAGVYLGNRALCQCFALYHAVLTDAQVLKAHQKMMAMIETGLSPVTAGGTTINTLIYPSTLPI